MKKLLFIACMVLTVTSGFAGDVGENETGCAEMIQSSRNANVETATEGEVVKEVKTEGTVQ